MAKENKALITLFGAAGDLAQRKLYPSLFNLYKKGYLAEHFALLGTSRRPLSDEDFQQMVLKSVNGMENEKGKLRHLPSTSSSNPMTLPSLKHYTVLKANAWKELDKQIWC